MDRHAHRCTLCGRIYTRDYSEHEKEPGVEELHAQSHVVYEALRGWTSRASATILTRLRVGEDPVNAIDDGLSLKAAIHDGFALYESEKAMREEGLKPFDVTRLRELLAGLAEWLVADTADGSWSHLGFWARVEAVPERGVVLSAEPSRGWLGISLRGVRFAQSGGVRGIIRPITDEQAAQAQAVIEEFWPVSNAWGGGDFASWNVAMPFGPGLAAAYADKFRSLTTLPRGWTAS